MTSSTISISDRAAGAVMGALIGDALGVGPHWYGMPCAIYHQLPAVYYLAARFPDDFEAAVLHALNGGGQNQARCILTGALAGAQVGLSGIPHRFLDGLVRSSELIALAQQLGEQAARSMPEIQPTIGPR